MCAAAPGQSGQPQARVLCPPDACVSGEEGTPTVVRCRSGKAGHQGAITTSPPGSQEAAAGAWQTAPAARPLRSGCWESAWSAPCRERCAQTGWRERVDPLGFGRGVWRGSSDHSPGDQSALAASQAPVSCPESGRRGSPGCTGLREAQAAVGQGAGRGQEGWPGRPLGPGAGQTPTGLQRGVGAEAQGGAWPCAAVS